MIYKLLYLVRTPVANNFGWLFFERMIRLSLGLLVGSWVARYLGPERYGLFIYYIAYIALFGTIANLGLDGIVVRECSKHPASAAHIVNTVLSLRLICGLVCWIISIIFLFITEGFGTSMVMGAIAGSTLAWQSADTLDLWFQSRGKNNTSVYAKLTAFVISNAIKIFLILLKSELIYFILLTSIEAMLAASILYYAYKKNGHSVNLYINIVKAKTLLKESWPFMLSGMTIIIYMRIDQIFIKKLLSDYDLGQYSVGIVFSQFWYFLPVIMSTAIAPHLAKAKSISTEIYNKHLLTIFRLFLFSGLFVTIFNYFTADLMIGLMYGEKYKDAVIVLKIHSFTNIFVFMGVAQNLWVFNEGKGKINLIKTVMGTIVSLIGNTLFIQSFGIIGAAYTAVAAQALSAFLSNLILAPRIFFLQIGFNKYK